ncbi:MAG: hypothetical protein HS115_08480 [Spirochaetales bacterium]|nr:hypothetical protein [Spirochaetales bacterium]
MKFNIFLIIFIFSIGGLFAQEEYRQSPSTPGTVELRFRLAGEKNVWESDTIAVRVYPAVAISASRLLVGGVDARQIIDVRFRKDGELLPARLIGYDVDLQLLLVECPGHGLRKVTVSRNHLRSAGQTLELHSIGEGSTSRHTVHVSGYGAGPSPGLWQTMPFLFVDGPASPAGSLLLSRGALAGIIIASSQEGQVALPAPFVASFLSRRFSAKSALISVTDYYGTTSFPVESVLVSPGFTVQGVPASSRLYYRVRSYRNAAVVEAVLPFQSFQGILEPGDVITSVDGRAVQADASVNDPVLGPLPLAAAAVLRRGQLKKPGERLQLTIQRGNRVRSVSARLSPLALENFRILPADPAPAFTIVGGLVFRELDGKSAERLGLESYLSERYNSVRKKQRIVILERSLPGAMEERPRSVAVISLNGVGVADLQNFYYEVEDLRRRGETIVLTLSGNEKLVLDPAGLTVLDQRVKERNGIPFLSGNLKALP